MAELYSADFHCDVLWKLLENPSLSFEQDVTNALDVTLPRLRQAGAVLQTFAIYVSERMEKSMLPILRSIDLFQRKVLTVPEITLVRTSDEAAKLQGSGKIGAMLSLEGADGLNGDLAMLRILFALGVRAVGLTWNHANWAADGVMEPRGGGLTKKGRALVEECNRLGILVDVSHLSDRAFWDVLHLSSKPVIASHSNCRAICPHPRNLADDQLTALLAAGGMVGVTFVPQFVASHHPVQIADVLRHIERICELGGAEQLMFGSDFDGIETYVDGLAHPGEVEQLQKALLSHYSESTVAGFCSGNMLRFLAMHLPD
ncbi:membrane dipeptidase [Paenibacillus taihuensis]|uniref:Membrane dipeptidase n=1 Tax=Paenibacillus taihuensis TaxID=1156355 RepID=A0A3D9SEZ4_9BACL|nr:dipeptidase [Paenibacillus taihuensis]REE94498.1 membrane dipeptidase [Paenibacillus taihuensis]